MHKIYHTAIVGGGASGLISAVELTKGDDALLGEDIVILEKNDRVGKKLIATGNGQGNLTNVNQDRSNYYGNEKFIDGYLANLSKINLVEYFNDLGIYLTTDKQGKIYPLSKQASSVLDLIRACLKSKKVSEITKAEVTDIKRKDGVFELQTEAGKFKAKTVVFATGGAVAKQFGTDGSSYKLAENFGHKITPLYPSLVQLKTETASIRGLKGLKETARVTAYYNGKPIKQATGDLLFTEFGVSGSSIFSVSAGVTDKRGVILNVEFLPELSREEVEDMLVKRAFNEYIDKENVFTGIVNKRIGQAVVKTAKSLEPKDLATALKNFRLKVTGNIGNNYAQVTKGGIETNDVDVNTMQSKLEKGLYVVGEALNVDGDCGGYNLTFAFVSAIVSARAIKSRFEKGN